MNINRYTPEEIYKMWSARFLDEQDPVINYWSHESLPNTIIVELYSGFAWCFQANEIGGRVLNAHGDD